MGFHRPMGICKLQSSWTLVDGRLMHARVFVHKPRSEFPAAVLVHGLGVSSHYMVPTATRLAPSCSVYAPDRDDPGSARGTRLHRADEVGAICDLAATIGAFRGDQRCVPRCQLLGSGEAGESNVALSAWAGLARLNARKMP